MTENGIDVPGTDIRVHVLEAGQVVANKTFLHAGSWPSLLRRPEAYRFPVYAWLLEHPEGPIAIDAGLTAAARLPPRALRRMIPAILGGPEDEIGPVMRRRGLRPEDVRTVVVTHLDPDHVGGIGHFPRSEVLVHRRDVAFADTRLGRSRSMTDLWPDSFAPAAYDLEDEPYGPFPRSRAITDRGDVRVVPLPGHTPGQVGVVVEAGETRLLFAADHMLRQDWFVEGLAEGRLVQLGIWSRAASIETSRRLQRFVEERPTVLLPSHDDEAPARLAAMTPCPTGGARRAVPVAAA